MSRMARRRQSAIEEPEPTSQQPLQTPAAQAHSAASAAPSVFTSSPQVTGDTRPTRRSRKELRTAQVFDLLLGDDLAGRKNHIADNGYKYLELADIS